MHELLAQVSRSFYLTLRVLPASIRPQISLAYLLARTSDTIADTELLPVTQRLAALQAFGEGVQGKTERLALAPFLAGQASPAERALLERVEEALAALRALSPADRELVQAVLGTIISGQALDLQRFGNASAAAIQALSRAEELDDYAYRVAGCVGEFWTRICCRHLFAPGTVDEAYLLANGVRFGKGLQLVNILRDLPRDLRQGRCYLPAEELAALGLAPRDLLEAPAAPRLRPLYNAWVDVAQAHLEAGWAYTNHLPRRAVRVRLACAWPVLIGVQTLAILRHRNMLDATQRIRIGRGEVRRTLWSSLWRYPRRAAWERLFLDVQRSGQ